MQLEDIRNVEAHRVKPLHSGHRGLATRTAADGRLDGLGVGSRDRLIHLHTKRGAKQRNIFAASGMMQPEVADLDEAPGQDVLEESAQELRGRK